VRTKPIIRLSTILYLVFFLQLLVLAAPVTTDLCTSKGYTVAYFNGIRTTPDGALDDLAALRDLKGTTLNEEPIQYESFYNQTGGFWQDAAEVFEQRAQEIDNSGLLGKRWEYFWEGFGSDNFFSSKIIEVVPNTANLFSQLYTDITSKAIAGWSYLLSNPPTEVDYLSHDTRLNALAIQGQKLMLIAHSQGNLFVNQAYDYIAPKIGTDSVRVVHVAPASPTLRGPYVLANIDVVINGLRAQGVSSVPDNNIDLPLLALRADNFGHSLTQIYLNPDFTARARIVSLISLAMQALQTPTTGGSVGSFTLTLTWDGTGDVDLHTFEPNGAHSYYSSRAGQVGYLDVDNTSANGPEHYFASCDPNVLQTGVYQVGINNYSAATGRTATVQVSTSKGGTILTKTLSVGPELGTSGNDNPIPVFNVIVSKDSTGATFNFTAQ
jgi:hypothetical protein